MEKRFNILLDKPPITAHVNGRTYPVQFDFRIALGYLRLLGDKDETDESKALLGLVMFFGDDIHRDDIAFLLDYISWFLRRGIEPRKDRDNKRVFDMIVDSNRVYSAFFQTYRINLRQVKTMHWWVFCELIEGLPKGTHLSDIIEIRGRTPEKWMTAAQTLELSRLQDEFRIEEKPKDVMGDLFDFLAGIS